MLLKKLSVIVLLFLCAVNVKAASINGVGIKTFEVEDPVEYRPMQAAVFFPSSQQTGVLGCVP